MATLSELVQGLTPARVFSPRAGVSLATSDWLQLRADHAFARDAVFSTLHFSLVFPPHMVERLQLFEVFSQAQSRQEYLLNPVLGRSLSPQDRTRVLQLCPARPRLQIFLGDGLSPAALTLQGSALLQELWNLASLQGWAMGRPFLVHQARVGLLNEVGHLLEPEVAILLIGERPGLSTVESLSAYMAYRPTLGDTDASRNLISNIHSRGVGLGQAAQRIVALAAAMLANQTSGVGLKERSSLPAPGV
ncbi:MAG: ethanolamine ammonia-lyase subunit EutC [Gemmataceae bacterium]|nr:ethanolamine ammonia-lyase subunit EutC [Gemmataceae bacterium]